MLYQLLTRGTVGAGVLVLTVLSAIAADDYPTTGLLYHTTENSALTFYCTKMQDGSLECDFNQSSVRKKGKAADLAKQLEKAKKEFPDALKEMSSDKECQTMGILASVARGDQTPEQILERLPPGIITDKQKFIEGMNKMTEGKKQDILEGTELLLKFCQTGSLEDYLGIVKHEHSKEVRTCRLGSNAYKQNFKWVSDYQSNTEAWVVQSGGPEGPCGLINLSRFERVQSSPGITFWIYYAKKAVTNPKGSVFMDMTCKDLDEKEYLYDWKEEKDLKLGCEYIEFSVF